MTRAERIAEILKKIDMGNKKIIHIDFTENVNLEKFENPDGGLKCYLLPAFKKCIWGHRVHFEFESKLGFVKHPLLENTKDREILQIRNFNKLITQNEILETTYFLTRQRPEYDHDYSIIVGYCICSEGTIKVIDVSWDEAKHEWECGAHKLGSWLGSLNKDKDEILEILEIDQE